MNTKKKIIFLVTQSEFGGAQRFIYTLIQELRRYTQIKPDLRRDTQINADISASISVSPKAGNQRISAIDYEVVVGAGPEGDDEKGLLFALEKIGINTKHLKYLRRSVNPFFDFLGLIEIYNLIKKQKPDILFLCSSKAGFLGSLAARGYTQIESSDIYRRNTQIHAENFQRVSAYSKGQNQRLSARPKVIYRIGGWTFNDPWSNWKKKLYIWLEKWSARFKDIIVNNAEVDRQQAIKLGIKPREKIITIYNGIDINSLKFLPSDKARSFLEVKIKSLLSRSHFTPRTTPLNAGVKGRCKGDLKAIVGTIADLYPTKGLRYLTEAANIIRSRRTQIAMQINAENYQRKSAYPEGQNQRVSADIRFIIIGQGKEKKNLENLIKKYNLENNFFLTGIIPEAYKYLKAFDIFVLPSVKEGFPWVILEAMVAEIPIIATKVGAVPEIIEDGNNGLLVEPANPKELAKAINNLLENKNLGKEMAKKAKKTIIEKFNLDRMVREVEKLL